MKKSYVLKSCVLKNSLLTTRVGRYQFKSHSKSSLKANQGFTIVEVMIAMALSSIALLGLALAQLKSLQYATNSFNYTVSLIQANNAVERTWVNLCDLQRKAAGDTTYQDHVEVMSPDGDDISGYTMEVVPVKSATFDNNLNITVRWQDRRLTTDADDAAAENMAVVNAEFPTICAAAPAVP